MPRWGDRLPMPAAYFELALREFGATAELAAALRDGTGVALGESAGEEITLGQQVALARNLSRLGPADWALRLASRFDAATHGPLGFAAVSAPTLRGSIDVIGRFSHVRAPYFRLLQQRDGERVVLRVEERLPLDDAERIPLLESLLLSLQRLVALVVGRSLREATFEFAWPAPPWGDTYGAYYDGTVRFDVPHTQVTIPAAWLDLTCPTADAGMYEASVRKLDVLARRLESDDHVVARVEQLIGAAGAAGLSLAQVAKRTRLSTRTLIRRLRRAGTTYHELLDAHRREQAMALLANPDFDVAEVSHLLGYGDPTNFGRACRRWFGMAPGRYRRRLGA